MKVFLILNPPPPPPPFSSSCSTTTTTTTTSSSYYHSCSTTDDVETLRLAPFLFTLLPSATHLHSDMSHSSSPTIPPALIWLFSVISFAALSTKASADSAHTYGSCDLAQYADPPHPHPPQDFDSLIDTCHSSSASSCLAASLASLPSSNKRLRAAASCIVKHMTAPLPCTPSFAHKILPPFLSNRYNVFGPFPSGKNEVDGTHAGHLPNICNN